MAAAAAALMVAFASTAAAEVRINEIQVLGTHNSYRRAIDPRLMAIAAPVIEKSIAGFQKNMPPEKAALFAEEHPAPISFAEGLSYDHPTLSRQLDAGLRSLEIDVYADPVGGLYRDPAGYRALRAQGATDLPERDEADMDKPGFKVMHVADFDVRSWCSTLKRCLGEVRAWSEAHPGHAPIFILMETKTQSFPLFPGAASPAPFDAKAFEALDAEIEQSLGRGRLITPDDVRGGHATLEAAVRAGAWPKLNAARGKVVILLIDAAGGAIANAYAEGRPSLEGRAAFLRGQPGKPHAAFLMYDNSKVRLAEIQARVREGYLVRTRSDIETYEAKVNDPSRAEAAFASGAQIVSTDFFQPGNVYGTPYVVRLPGGGDARCNPVNAPRGCTIGATGK
jgi:hypothetical protein